MILRGILTISIAIAAQAADLMPAPAKVAGAPGKLAIDGNFRIALQGIQDDSVAAGARRLITRLIKQTGLPLTQDLSADAARAALLIRCGRPREPVQT
ncbi:MAG: hypothetical protein ACR2I2_11945 [Bryobacteraceae bacterium]